MNKKSKFLALAFAYTIATTSLSGCTYSPTVYRSDIIKIVNNPSDDPQIFIYYSGNQYVKLEGWEFRYVYDTEALRKRNEEINAEIEDIKLHMPVGGYLRSVAKRDLEFYEEELDRFPNGALTIDHFDSLSESSCLTEEEKKREFWNIDELFALSDRMKLEYENNKPKEMNMN